jgi:thimet oligopeptidase
MHPREGKYKHAAQFSIISGLKDRQYPEGALVCNFPDPKDGAALMEHPQVVTMFHEFGHLLHYVFAGGHQWIPLSGVATEWDFVEAPSQFLEEWAWSPKVLQMFALHYETNEPIPVDLVKKMRAAEEFGKAIAARQQMFYAALSVDYFDRDPKSFDLLKLLKSLQAQYSYFPYEEGTHFHYSFGHLEGYSAMYYTYMWSLSLAKDLFEPFKQNDIMNKALARRFRDMVLTPGGAKDAKDLVTQFLGREPTFEAFEKWLTKDPLEAVN